jgi:hypothetical protein
VTPQLAVPVGLTAAAVGGAGPAAASDVNLVGVPAATDKAKAVMEDDRPQVSPTDPVSGLGRSSGQSEPVSAMTQEERPLPLAKHDGAADEFMSSEYAGSMKEL